MSWFVNMIIFDQKTWSHGFCSIYLKPIFKHFLNSFFDEISINIRRRIMFVFFYFKNNSLNNVFQKFANELTRTFYWKKNYQTQVLSYYNTVSLLRIMPKIFPKSEFLYWWKNKANVNYLMLLSIKFIFL